MNSSSSLTSQLLLQNCREMKTYFIFIFLLECLFSRGTGQPDLFVAEDPRNAFVFYDDTGQNSSEDPPHMPNNQNGNGTSDSSPTAGVQHNLRITPGVEPYNPLGIVNSYTAPSVPIEPAAATQSNAGGSTPSTNSQSIVESHLHDMGTDADNDTIGRNLAFAAYEQQVTSPSIALVPYLIVFFVMVVLLIMILSLLWSSLVNRKSSTKDEDESGEGGGFSDAGGDRKDPDNNDNTEGHSEDSNSHFYETFCSFGGSQSFNDYNRQLASLSSVEVTHMMRKWDVSAAKQIDDVGITGKLLCSIDAPSNLVEMGISVSKSMGNMLALKIGELRTEGVPQHFVMPKVDFNDIHPTRRSHSLTKDGVSLYNLDHLFHRNCTIKEHQAAMAICKLAADQGCAAALYDLGSYFSCGEGKAANYPEAFKYFKLAADLDHAKAQLQVGTSYFSAEGVAQNKEEGFRYMKKAADQGLPIAQFSVAMCYRIGDGVSINEYCAFEYFQMSAVNGSIPAQYETGNCFYHRQGVDTNGTDAYDERNEAHDISAFKFYKLAADQGHVDAQCQIGQMYYQGIGTRKSFSEALKYFKLAAEQYKTEAIEMCNILGSSN